MIDIFAVFLIIYGLWAFSFVGIVWIMGKVGVI